jgi:GNAT superfamily N-acetyltransferase
MIAGATPDHLALIGDVLAYGGRSGSWDPSLGNRGANLDALLAKLGYAFIHGVLPQIDPRTGAHIETRIAGYVFHVGPGTPPIGFGLFKDFTAAGYELWMLGIAEPYRGKGYGRAMLSEFFATPIGSRVMLARCAWASEGSRRCSHVLYSHGFAPCRATRNEEWLLHSRTPTAVLQMIRTMDMSPFEPRYCAG